MIRKFEWDLIESVMAEKGLQWDGLKVLQLGDMYFRVPGAELNGKILPGRRRYRSKAHMEALGAEVVSIDTNGRGGSLPIDLGKPFDPEYGYEDRFDLIINSGTSEHVHDPLTCHENVYNACKKGGVMFNLNPREGFWLKARGHRNCYKYTVEFWEEWAEVHDCEVHTIRVVDFGERAKDQDDLILAILIK